MSFKTFQKNQSTQHHLEDAVWTDGVHGVKRINETLHLLHAKINASHSVSSMTEDEESVVQHYFDRASELYKDILPGVLNKIGVNKSIHKPILFYIRHSDDSLRVEMPVVWVTELTHYIEHLANEDIKSVKLNDAVHNREKKKSEQMNFFRSNRNQLRLILELYNTFRHLRHTLTQKLSIDASGEAKVDWNKLLKEDTESQWSPIVSDFVNYCKDYLHLPAKPNVHISFDSNASKEHKTFGHFTPASKEIVVYASGRHIVDVLRTLAHEIVHFAQSHETDDLDGSTGSHHENDANTRAGIILRNYQGMNSHLFNMNQLTEAKFTKFSTGTNAEFHVQHSPVASTVRAQIDKAKSDNHGFKQIRAITDPEGKLHTWDGWHAIHHHVSTSLGHNEYTTHWLDVKGKQYNTHSMAGGTHKDHPETPDIEHHQHKENGKKFRDLVDKALKPHGYEHTTQWKEEEKPFHNNLAEADMRSLDSDYSIPRKEMPQIAADDHKDFIYHLKQHGVMTTHENVPVHTLKPTQKNFDADKVKNMSMGFATDPKKPIMITRDNDILDGHHRWKKLLDHNPQNNIRAIRLNTTTPHAIEVSKKFPKAFFKK